jgi:hypothetical protein
MPGPSQISIINGGLDKIAQKPIVAITGTSLPPQALAAARAWDSALQASLREAAPGFATAIVALALYATTPLHWLYAYKYPANCLNMLFVYNEGETDPARGQPFRELYTPDTNERIIVTNCDLAYGEYVYLVSDPTLFDPSFVKVMEYRLAADLAIPLVGDRDLAKQMDENFKIAASECDRYNAGEQQQSAIQSSAFIKARG